MENELIVIIDSGIDIHNKKIMESVTGGVGLQYSLEREQVVCQDDFQDEFGQGTNCADFIIQSVPDSKLYPIKILNRYNMMSSQIMIEALKRCIDIPAKAICVSLSVLAEDDTSERKMYDICETLAKQGKIVCASENKYLQDSIPARFGNVIGVRAGREEDKQLTLINQSENIQVTTDGRPIFLQGLGCRYNFWGGNAKANAYFTGCVMKLLRSHPEYNTKQLLEHISRTVRHYLL